MPSIGAGQMPENLAFGAALSSLSFFCTAVMSALVKATEELTSTAVVLLFQNLICLLIFVPITLHRGWASLRTDKIGLHILRAATGTAAWYALFVAITLMPLTNAILLTFSAPLWMPVIAWVVFRHRAATATWVGAAIGFIGVVFVLQPHHADFNIGAVYALAGAFFLAVALMSVGWLGATEPMPRILFYYFLFSTVLVAPFALIDWKPFGARASIYLDRHRVDTARGSGSHRLRISLRVGGQGGSLHLHRHRFHRTDRLGHLGPGADAFRRPGNGAGDRRRNRRDSQEIRCVADRRRHVAAVHENDRNCAHIGGPQPASR